MIKLPDGPKTPSFWQLLHWIANPVNYMETTAERYGDLFTAKVGAKLNHLVFVSNPQSIQQILTNDRKQFTAPGEMNKMLSTLVGDTSLIMLDGERHKQRRQLLMPPFHGERMRAYGELICRLTQQVMEQVPRHRPFLARPAMQAISLQVIMEAVFGMTEGERYERLKQVLASMLEMFRSPMMASVLFFEFLQQDWGQWSPWGKFCHNRAQVDALLYAEIAERRAHPDSNRTDILSLLMSAQDEAGESLSDGELRDELMLLLFAGHETTATAMAWGLYWTHHFPEVRQKIREELATLGDAPDSAAIARLPYLTAVCQETLRLYPVAMLTFPRVAQEPVELAGESIEPGTILMGCIYLLHQREDIYPQHSQFRPERFLERQFSPYEFMPFGGGARRCIGEALALFEMKLVLATILSHYDLALADSRLEKPQRRGLTLTPARGVKMVVQQKLTVKKPLAKIGFSIR